MANPTTAGVSGNAFHVDASHANVIGGSFDIGNADAHGGSGFFGNDGPVTAGVAGNDFHIDANHANLTDGSFNVGNADASHFHFDFIPL